MKVFYFILALVMLIPLAASWNLYTHRWICNHLSRGNHELGQKLDMGEFLRGCVAPDVEFQDQQNHNCYVAKECKKIDVMRTSPATLTYFTDINSCFDGKYLSCPTLQKFNESIDKATGANYSFFVGVAVHYLSDAFVPLHQVTGEDYWSCHAPFEDKVGNMLSKGHKETSQKCTIYFPCRAVGKTIRKCNESYETTITLSYQDMVSVVDAVDGGLSSELNLTRGNYSYLNRSSMTSFLTKFLNEILYFFHSVFG